MKVTYKRHWGSDLDVVNNARVSFDKESEWVNGGGCLSDKVWPNLTSGEKSLNGGVLSAPDKSLIKFLARGCTSGDWDGIIEDVLSYTTDCDTDGIKSVLNHVRKMPSHWVPFANGVGITLHLKVPLFVQRQLDKHQVGFTTSEMSRRYVTSDPEFYVPEVWRKAADNVKQGSSDEAVGDIWMQDYGENYKADVGELNSTHLSNCTLLYNSMIAAGVCGEQARSVLPQSTYVESIKSGSLYGWANLYNQRADSHAQKETQQVAAMVQDIIKPLYPESWEALTA